MKTITTIVEMRAACGAAKQGGKRLGFVPTMGALHEGHLSLVRSARESCDVVAASIFVNPKQFGPNEDFAKYPRDLERDSKLLAVEGVALLFAPSAEEMYPAGEETMVYVEGLSERLCGRSRPGHFRGVTTVVAKLFNIIEPDAAFFGQKDAAQIAIIRRMVWNLNFPVEIIGCPIVRESDGLAKSSRNAYLTPAERKQALALSRALREIEKQFAAGARDVSKLVTAGKTVLAEEPAVHLDYLEIVSPESLEVVQDARGALVAIAAFVGGTRLIDNVILQFRATG
jgi:pantoate--beta-alanine ligase